ncbi:MAG: PAS domain S-box protein [Desulfovibrionaceae bacterium]
MDTQTAMTRWSLATLFLAASAVLAALGFWAFRHQVAAIRAERQSELRTVATLKIGQISTWRRERVGDAATNTSGPLREALLRAVADQGNNHIGLLSHWRGLRDAFGYENVLLFDESGQLILCLDDIDMEPELLQLVHDTASAGEALFGDFFPCSRTGRVHLDVAAPLFDEDGASAGVLVLRCDPNAFLFPLIQAWPIPRTTAETLLVRKDGAQVLYLNTLLLSTAPPMTIRIPLTRTDTPAARAVAGAASVSSQGKDYRGAEVVAEVMPVPDTRWFMVSKIDVAEIVAAARSSQTFIATATSLGITCSALLLLVVAQGRKRVLLNSLYQSEKQLARSRTVMAASNDSAFVIDPSSLQFLDVNDTACRVLGYDRAELLGMTLGQLDPAPSKDWDRHIREVRESGTALVEATHRRKDGTCLPVEIGMRHVPSEHGDFLVATARDITERKRQERVEGQRRMRTQALVDLFEQMECPAEGIAEASVNTLVRITDSRLGFLGFIDDAETTMSTQLWSEHAMQSCAVEGRPVDFSIPDGGLWTAAIREKRAVTVNDYTASHPLKKGCPEGHVELSRLMTIPLIRNGRVIMVAGLANKSENYTEQDQRETTLFLESLWGILTRKQAEEALKRSEDRWRRTINLAPFPIMVHAEDGEVISVNQAWEKLTGYDRRQIPYITDWTRLAYGNDALGVASVIDSLYAILEPKQEGQFVVTAADGRKLVWDFASAPLGSLEDGRRTVISMAHDITELKDAQRQLETSHAHLEAVMNNLDAVVYVADMQTHELLFLNNYGSTRLKKFSPGMKCFEVLQQGQQTPCPFCTNERLVNSEGRPTGVYRWEFQNTITKRWFDCRDQAILWRDGRLVRLEIAVDITDRKKHEEELNALAQDLLRSNQELEQFAYVASHDLQEPLRMVSSYTQLLADRYNDRLDQDAKDFIAYAVDGANRMQRLIQDLLAFSRVTTQGGEMTKVDMHEVLAEALRNLHSAVIESGALVSTEELPPVRGDRPQLVQLMQNLLSNAVKFRVVGRQPLIRVAATECPDAEGFWTFSVSDNGIGIEERFFEKIFAIFQRLHGRQEYPGTGIGLALCKRIIDRHGGRIRVQSTPGEGSTFFFTLPRITKKTGGTHEKHAG